MADPLVGRVLDGRYHVQARIARGGMATVYLALDARLDREVALKVMHGHLAEDAEFQARFVREARSAARMSHPNVVQVFDQGADDGVLYLAMEHLPGRTLRDVLAERGALTPREAITVLDPVLDALAAAHRAGIVHRDTKPENVLLTDDGRVKVADFGLARAATTTATTGTLIGTVAYLSPELVSRGVADARSDVYACGIMLLELLTGRPPFTGDVPIQVAFQHVHDEVPPPSDVVPEVPAELDDVVLGATAQDPDERFPDAATMLADLRLARADLSPDVLDHRPAVAEQIAAEHHAAAAGAAGDTEVVTTREAALNRTQALPGGVLAPAFDLRPAGHDRDLRESEAFPALAEGEQLTRRRRRRGAFLLVLVLLLAAGLGGGTWWFLAGPGSRVAVPAVATLPLDQAAAKVEAAGLGTASEEVFDDAAAPGVVVGARPTEGADVARDAVVTLLVSKGPELFAVPTVVGSTQEQAQAALTAANLAVGEVKGAYDDDAPPGQVLSSAPAQGQQARRDTPVALVVSRGPEPVEVPSVVGRSQADAERRITDARLEVRSSTEISERVPKGDVISQSPDSGTLLPGETVSIVVSSGPPLVDVPRTFRMSFAEAKKLLESRGFTVKREGTRIFDEVYQTVPGGGTKAPKGSTVVVRTF